MPALWPLPPFFFFFRLTAPALLSPYISPFPPFSPFPPPPPASSSSRSNQGVRPLRDWLHARHLTLGLYTSDAERSCKPTAGSLYHESQDAATLAVEYGVDFIKVDDCGEVNLNSFAKYSALRDAFNRTGRAVSLSCEPHVTSAIGWLPEVCNQWRTTSDNCNLAVDYTMLPGVLAQNNWMQVRHFPAQFPPFLTVLSWICVEIHMCGALPSPVCA